LAERFRGARFSAGAQLQPANAPGSSRAARLRDPRAARSFAALAEIHRGTWQGLPTAQLLAEREREVASFYADPWNWREHGARPTATSSRARGRLLESGLKRHGGPLAIACHYNVVAQSDRACDRYRSDGRVPRAHRLDRVRVLHDGPRGWVLERCNVRSPRGALG